MNSYRLIFGQQVAKGHCGLFAALLMIACSSSEPAVATPKSPTTVATAKPPGAATVDAGPVQPVDTAARSDLPRSGTAVSSAAVAKTGDKEVLEAEARAVTGIFLVSDSNDWGLLAQSDDDTSGSLSSLYTPLNFGEAKVSGNLAPELITRDLKSRAAHLLSCYAAEGPATSRLTTTFSFSINARGAVTKASVKGATGAFATCLVGVIKSITFPARKSGTVKVTCPLVIDLRGSPQLDSESAGGGGTGGPIGIGSYSAPGSVGTESSYGVLGRRTGTDTDYGVGRGLSRRKVQIPAVRVGKPAVAGTGLDRAVIRRYIMRARTKITYCYEKELARNPKLAGMVKTTFVIGEDGFVSASSAVGIDPEVSRCVAGVIKAIQFPKPSSGSVTVGYPFTFAAPRK